MRSDILQSCICASVPLIHSVLNSEEVSARPEALFFETSLVCLISDTTREIPIRSHRATGSPFFCACQSIRTIPREFLAALSRFTGCSLTVVKTCK
jgi:hypothetical protein